VLPREYSSRITGLYETGVDVPLFGRSRRVTGTPGVPSGFSRDLGRVPMQYFPSIPRIFCSRLLFDQRRNKIRPRRESSSITYLRFALHVHRPRLVAVTQ
jgi:hypothetical protein